MVEKDIIAVKSAIESMKASNWANKDEKIKQLEENLDPQYDEIPKGIDSTGYEDAQRLIKSSNWDESEKERVLKLLSENDDVVFLQDFEEAPTDRSKAIIHLDGLYEFIKEKVHQNG